MFIVCALLCASFAHADGAKQTARGWNEVSQTINQLNIETTQKGEQVKQAIKKDRATLIREVRAIKQKGAAAKKRAEMLAAKLQSLREQETALKLDLEKSQAQMNKIESTVRDNSLALLAGRSIQPGLLRNPERMDRLSRIAAPDRFPSMNDIAFLLNGLVSVIDESGNILRSEGPILLRDGSEAVSNTMRIGAFQGAFVSNEAGFLVANPQAGIPQSAPYVPYENEEEILRAAMAGSNLFPLDISQGRMLTDPPTRETLIDKLKNGGVFLWPIIAIGFLGMLIIIERCVVLYRTGLSKGHSTQESTTSTPSGRVVQRMRQSPEGDSESAERLLEEAILDELPPLERFLQTLRVFAAVSPLMGLLGTVSGIIQTFRVITQYGNGDPTLLSSGISEALLTTEMGLVVAIPLLLCHHFLTRRKNAIILDMETAGAAFIASHSRCVA